eukprot:4543356-Karenia_brevis.AAC.1
MRARRDESLAAGHLDETMRRRDAAADATHPCRSCGEEKAKGEFWPVDWRSNRARGISCKTCQGTPPSSRA